MNKKLKTRTLSEHASKELLVSHGIPFAKEIVASNPNEAVSAAKKIGYPVVVKLQGANIAHKTERNLVRLGLPHDEAVLGASQALLAEAKDEDGDVSLIVAEMLRGNRELIIGFYQDDEFGPVVLLGLGGILTEALGDVVFASAPVDNFQARRMIDSISSKHLLFNEFRGEKATQIDSLVELIVNVSKVFQEDSTIKSIDINPVIINKGIPIGADALIEIGEPIVNLSIAPILEKEALKQKFNPLFYPKGIAVVGVSSHPGRFGSVAFHNILRYGYEGDVFAINRDGAEILGIHSYQDISDIPPNKVDLAFIATPPKINEEILEKASKLGIKAAFVAAGGYSESNSDGKLLEDSLVETANKLNMIIAGPNGQGIISTDAKMCAQIASPYPPSGSISIVSQSGNILSSLMNHAIRTGVGVNKGISCGNSAQTKVTDYLNYLAADDSTSVVIAYLEGINNGPDFINTIKHFTSKKPLIVIKGGVANEGIKAASSHTGSMATDNRIFSGICNQYGVIQAPSVEDAYDWAATFASQPLPLGKKTVIFTTAGGWGVLAADAIAQTELNLIDLPKDIIEEISKLVPSRWSNSNPVDLAGGETRDTIPQVIDILSRHQDVDAIIHLGIGIQSAQAHAFESGKFYKNEAFELNRLVKFHQKQDERYAQAAVMSSRKYNKPILTASELVNSDRHYGNPGPLSIKNEGRVCYESAHRAVKALQVLAEYSDYKKLF